jgi:ABC-type sugar transport system permease subunit
MISGLIFSLVFKQFVNQPLIEIMNLFGDKDFPNLFSTPQYTYSVMIFYNIWSSFGMSVIFYANAMTGISPEVVESSQLDGVYNMFQELWYILLPMTFPTFKTMLVIGITSLFTADYGLTTFFMYGAPAETWHMGYFYTVKVYNSSSTGYPVLAASGIVLTAISTPVVLFLRNWLERIDPMEG